LPPQRSDWSGKAQGAVVRTARDGAETVMWTRELVNIPVSALMTNDGKHVVTFDTWAKLGYEHAVVIYGEGAVVADYSLEALLSADEIASSVPKTATTRPWLQGATMVFDKSDADVVITLKWRRTIRIALTTGRIHTAQ
jgi:hypothetical protein